MSLIDEIKNKINYTNSCPKCKNCKYSEEVENKFIDRQWDRFCNIAVIETFKVDDNGRCDKYSTRSLPDAKN